MVWNNIDSNKHLGIQRFSHLDIRTKYQYLTGATILIPMSRFFGTITAVGYWYHAFTYLPDQHRSGLFLRVRTQTSFNQQTSTNLLWLSQFVALSKFPAPFTLMSGSTFGGAILFIASSLFTFKDSSPWYLPPGLDFIAVLYAVCFYPIQAILPSPSQKGLDNPYFQPLHCNLICGLQMLNYIETQPSVYGPGLIFVWWNPLF